MAKIPSFKRLYKNEFKPEYADLIEKLIISLNSIIDSIVDALNRKLSLKNNILCTVKDVTVTVNSQGIPTQPLNVSYDFTGNASVINVGRIVNLGNPTGYPTSGVTIYWQQINNTTIQVKHITGIIPNNSHSLRLVIYGDES